MEGKLIIFSAPSGSGKTSIVRHLISSGLNLEFSISATSRTKRSTEEDGRDYYFLTADKFREKIKHNEFVEWEEVYQDHYYGTLKSEIDRIWSKGSHVIFDVDVMGGIKLKKIFGRQALSVFIMPPSVETLRKRLEERGTDSSKNINMRVKKAYDEINRSGEFDLIIINDKLEEACAQALLEVRSFLEEK